ncbi:hypothetical protein KC19_11G172100 [Ceratodon purpureus]|uniref:Conserved oligomeric Golgi complex subunit 1 n=1 Tax=Ceratodon purpureus TaxID=3225 RepID=A0A8T0GHD0_CERPU|nr:hypothetical protein KC19_N008000 [Ceratodon purpureus]KAG0558005.1 hypothetical protein KC19_11G172100 [Ceratodon purpureus]
MRGGRFQAKTTEGLTFRNAESLFEAKTVAEIRDVEAQTRNEIEAKKEELRQLVGASYRDLIESADSITLMKQSCAAVAENITRMDAGFAALQRSVSVNVAAPGADVERKRRERLYELGSRVKYLVDTPEKIWGCLDEHMYLEGAERYLRAKEVHSLLTGAGVKEELGRFPLLRQQWPLIERFRVQISKRSKERLQEPGLSVEAYAVALAACGIIDELNSSQVFTLFLESRKLWLRSHLRAWLQERSDGRGGDDAADVAGALCKVLRMIQTSLCQIGMLFLEVTTGKMPLLFETVLAAPPGSQLFGGIPNPVMEVTVWKGHREKRESSMVSLTRAFISDACVEWLNDCAEEIGVEARPLIAKTKTGKELADVEGLVREDMNKQEAVAESLDWLDRIFGKSMDSPWDCVCGLLVDGPVNLWDKLYEDLFVSQMKIIVNSGFVSINVKEMVDGCLEAMRPAGAQEGINEKQALMVRASGNVLQELDLNSNGKRRSKSSSVESEWDGDARFFFTPDVTSVKDKVDESLRLILQDLVSFLQGPHEQIRTDSLAPFLQEQCYQWVSDVAKVLEAWLSKLSENMAEAVTEATNLTAESSTHVLEGMIQRIPVSSAGFDSHASKKGSILKVVEQALFLGRLSAALGEHSISLPSLLGSSTSWTGKNAPFGQTPAKIPSHILRQSLWSETNSTLEGLGKWSVRRGVGPAATYGSDDGAGKLRELQVTLRQQSIAAHRMWVQWSTDVLAGTLLRDLHQDECLSTPTPLKGWEETLIKTSGEDGEEVEARISVPAMPSPYVAAFLFAGCREVHRIGGHVLDRAVLELFAWELLEKVLTIYEKFMSHPSFMNSRVSEKGLLQLLFDLKFLADVLSGGQDVHLENTGAVGTQNSAPPKQTALKADIGRKRWVNKLLDDLYNHIDPIDWETYESYLWEQERRYYQSCAVLFGSLIQLKRLHTDVPQKPLTTAETNTLNMSATVPRFTYLPISAPLFSVTKASPLRSRRIPSQEENNAVWRASVHSDDASTFTFVDSQSQNSQGSAKLLQQLMGVGSKFGEGTFGKVLGDAQVGRFKDKGAAAISMFGDMLPAQAAGLFSSIGSAMKQDAQTPLYY